MIDSNEIQEKLSVPITKFHLHHFVESILLHPEDFPTVYAQLWNDNPAISWKAAWACEKIADARPGWFSGKEEEITALLLSCRHSGSRRLLLSILCRIPVPDVFPVALFDFCLEHALDIKEPPGVQSRCIKMAYKLCCREPELFYELKLIMDNADLSFYSKGLRTCFKNVKRGLEGKFSGSV